MSVIDDDKNVFWVICNAVNTSKLMSSFFYLFILDSEWHVKKNHNFKYLKLYVHIELYYCVSCTKIFKGSSFFFILKLCSNTNYNILYYYLPTIYSKHLKLSFICH